MIHYGATHEVRVREAWKSGISFKQPEKNVNNGHEEAQKWHNRQIIVTSTINNPKELTKALINWYEHNRGTGKYHLLNGTISKIMFYKLQAEGYKGGTTKEPQGS